MKKIINVFLALIIGSALTVSSAIASPASDALSTCLADNTTGKDRKDMARWIFIAMSAHPELHNLVNITEKQRDEINKALGSMVTKLMTESCPVQAKAALENDGGEAFKAAFGVVGRLAMQELMANQEVNSSFSEFSKYMDKDKIDLALGKK
jgi:hypothetical protein